MDNRYLISETTQRRKKRNSKKALGISLLGADMLSDDVLELAKQYIDGKLKSKRFKKVLEKYTNGGNK